MHPFRPTTALLTAAVLAVAVPQAAGQYAWTGGGVDANWTTTANWTSGVVPVNSADSSVTFAGSSNLAANQDIANPFVLNSLAFAPGAGSFTLGGNGLDFQTSSAGITPSLSLSGSQKINLAMTLDGNLTVTGTGSATLGRPITGTGGLTFNIAYPSTGNFVLTATNTYSGPTVINGCNFNLQGINGNAPNSSSFTVCGGSLNLTPGGRIASDSSQIGNVSVTLNGGGFALYPPSFNFNMTTSESYGNLVLNSGENGLFIMNASPPAAVLASTGTIVRSVGAVLDFLGEDIGRFAKVTFATPPALVGGGGAAGSTTIGIIPYAVAVGTSAPFGWQFATYGTNGVRPLSGAEYATSVTNGASTLINLAVSTAITGIDGPTTVNAIKLVSGGSISGGGVLTVNSGLIVSDSSSTYVATAAITVKTLAFGTREAIIRCADILDIESSITGTGGLTAYGVQNNVPLTLGGQNSFSGDIRAHTEIYFHSDANLGAASNVIETDKNGAFVYVGASVSVSRALKLDGGGSLAAIFGPMTFAGLITGTGPLQIGLSDRTAFANGTVELTGSSNTYSGGTVVVAATLRIPADVVMPAGTLTLNAGTLQAGSLLTMNRAVVLTGSGNKIDTNGFDVTVSGVISGGQLNKIGTGTLTLTGTNTYAGGTTIGGGTLQIGAGGTSGLLPGNVTDNAALVFNRSDTVTYSGGISGSGTLTQAGTGTLTLSGKNSYSGGTNVLNGTVQVPADAALGTGNVTGAALGTLAFTGTTTTTKSFAMNGGTITVAAGQTVTFNGGPVSSAFLDGAGTFATDATNGARFVSVTTSPSVAIISNSANDQFVHFTNGGALTVAPFVNDAGTSTTMNLNGFTIQGLGSLIARNSKFNVANFQSYGYVNLERAATGHLTLLTNLGNSPLGFDAGSRTFVDIPVAGPGFGAGVDLHGQNLVIAGGLFVNNGFVADSTATPGAVIVDYGALYKGAGTNFVNVITQNGGKVQAGNSPGSMGFGRFVFGPGGVNNYVFSIDDATGTAGPSPDTLGHVSGWGLVKAVKAQFGTTNTSGDFVWTATPSDKLTFAIDTLVNPTTVGTDVPGLMDHFDPNSAYSWPAVQWAGTYSGPTDTALLDAATSFDTSGFLNPVAGTFGWSLSGSSLSLSYTPSAVPEPGSFVLVALAAVGLARRRRRSLRFLANND